MHGFFQKKYYVVHTFFADVDFTVAIAFPAYTGRLKVDSSSIEITSVIGEISRSAAALGKKFLALFVAGAKICEKLDATDLTTSAVSSAAGWENMSLSTINTFETFLTFDACVATSETFLPSTSTEI